MIDQWQIIRQASRPLKPAPPTGPPDWTARYQRDRHGEPRAEASNIEIALAESPYLDGLFWWEVEEGRVWLFGRLPHWHWLAPDQARPIDHDDVTAIQIYVQRQCALPGIGRGMLYLGLRKIAKERAFRLSLFEGEA